MGKTFIREGGGGGLCQQVIGHDANALHFLALDQELPTGIFVRRRAENQFRPVISAIYIQACAWLDYLNLHRGAYINHFLNFGSELSIGPYPVDGFDDITMTACQYQGCYVHGHSCFLTKNVNDKKLARRARCKVPEN